MSRRIESVAVVGRDADALLAALGLQRAVGGTGVRVQLVELPSALRPGDAYAALPTLSALHRLLGLDHEAVLRACRGVPSLGQRFEGWSGPGSAFLHAYDIRRPGINDVDFLHYWVKARAEGLQVPLEDFSLAAAAAKQGRIGTGKAGPDSLGGFVPGCHLDARAYVGLLATAVRQAGVAHMSGSLARVERESDRITAVTMDGGARIEADLFVDASGAESALIGGMPGADFTSWAHWLPCDRALTASLPMLRPLPAFSNVGAFGHGWASLYPLQDRTALVAAYASHEISDDRALEAAARIARTTISGEVSVAGHRTGARARPWIGNCVALGAAAADLAPLDAVRLHLAQIGISNLVSVWPVEADEMPEAALYNDAVASHAANIRDFQIAHLKLNSRAGEPFWDRLRNMDVPESLDAKLRLFGARGEIVHYDDETFQPQSWSASFIGHGLIPRSYDPMVDAVTVEEQMEMVRRLLRVIGEEVRAMPSVEAYLAVGSRR